MLAPSGRSIYLPMVNVDGNLGISIIYRLYRKFVYPGFPTNLNSVGNSSETDLARPRSSPIYYQSFDRQR